MANPTGNNAEIGDFAKTAGIEVWSRLTDSTGVTKGDVVHFSTTGLAVLATSSGDITDGFGVALETKGASVACRFAVGNTYVYVTSDGTIVPNNLVKVAGTAGQVVAHTLPAASAISSPPIDTEIEQDLDTVRDFLGLIVGRYYAHQLEEVGDPTDAANDDIIAIRLGL